jgi:hypothetical protein
VAEKIKLSRSAAEARDLVRQGEWTLVDAANQVADAVLHSARKGRCGGAEGDIQAAQRWAARATRGKVAETREFVNATAVIVSKLCKISPALAGAKKRARPKKRRR